jgi:hypothetical protein
VTGLLKAALASLFDQSKPFGRLALVHCLQSSGSTLVTISLAGSLFFSISPNAAKSKVLLYLLLTIAPFALVGPALSPLLDRGRQARRTSVAIACIGSALLCFGMARNIHDLLLFPEAFGILVLGKLYLVARAALVPDAVAPGDDLASANARLAVLASLAGFLTMPIGVGLLKIGAPWVLGFGIVVFGLAGVASFRLSRVAPRSLPATGIDEAPAEETAARSPRYAEVADARRVLGLPLYPPEVVAGISAMSLARATVGFVSFFLAFALRRDHQPTYWFGLLIVASGTGSLIGSLIVPRLRRRMHERQIISLSLGLMTIGAIGAGWIGGLWAQLLLTFVVGVGPTSARPALDSIVQRNVPPALLGRAFGRLETRLQLVWVLASLIAVLIPFPLRVGDAVVAACCVLGALSYTTSAASKGKRRERPSVRAQRA